MALLVSDLLTRVSKKMQPMKWRVLCVASQ